MSEIIFESHIPEAIAKIDKTARARMARATQAVHAETMETLSGQRTGRVYKVPGTNKTYTASAPGEPPATRLGDLKKSVRFGVVDEGADIVGYVGVPEGTPADDYARRLECGTKKMGARPWLRPSFEKTEEKVKSILSEKWF